MQQCSVVHIANDLYDIAVVTMGCFPMSDLTAFGAIPDKSTSLTRFQIVMDCSTICALVVRHLEDIARTVQELPEEVVSLPKL